MPQNFPLQYEALSVTAGFQILNPNGTGLSRINKEATDACNAALWPAGTVTADALGVTFFATQQSAPEEDLCEYADPKIFLKGNAQPTTLFYIVVDGVPGETVRISCDGFLYQSGGGDNIECGNCNSFPLTDVIAAPANGNANLTLKLADPLAPQTTGFPCSMAVQVSNNSTSAPASIVQLSFILKVVYTNLMEPLTISAVAPFSNPSITLLTNQPLLKIYKITVSGPVSVGASGVRDVVTAQIPAPINQSLAASATFEILPGNAAVSTALDGCSSLQIASGTRVCQNPGESPCNPLVTPLLKVYPVPSMSDCKQLTVAVELSAAEPANWQFEYLSLELDFLTNNPDLKIGSMDDAAWGCTTPGGCFGSNCTDFSARTFKFCFDVRGTSSPTLGISSGSIIYITFDYPGNACIAGVNVRKFEMKLAGTGACAGNYGDFTADFPFCPPDNSVKGTIVSWAGSGNCVENVTVEATLNGGTTDCSTVGQFTMKDITDCSTSDDHYALCVCSQNASYKITPTRDDDPLNGVSTYDLLLISRHILGIEPLNSPLKMIAADGNFSTTITAFDISTIRKIILGIESNFSNNTSWRFIDKFYVFPNPANPFTAQFPEIVTVNTNNLPATADFIGVKVGDVNGNAVAHNRPVLAGTQPIGFPVMSARKGDALHVPVVFNGDQNLEAFQMGLQFEPEALEFIGTAPGDLEGLNTGYFGLTNIGQGQIRSLWLREGALSPEALRPGTVLFYLTFKAKRGFTDIASAFL